MSHWQLLKRLTQGIVRRRKRLVLLSVVVALMILLPVAYYLPKAPPRFRSTATVLLQTQPNPVPVFQEFAPSRPLAVQLSILKSRSLAESVLEMLPEAARKDLIENPLYVDYFELIYNAYVRLRGVEPQAPDPQRRAVQELRQGRLKHDTAAGEGLIDLSAEASKPQAAIDIVNTYVEVLLSRTRSFNVEDSRVAREFLEDQLAAVKKTLRDSEDALRVFTTARGGIKIPDQSQATVRQLSQVESALAEITTQRRMTETRLQHLREKVESQKLMAPALGPAPAPPAEIQRLRAQLTQLELALLDLRTKFTDRHPRVAVVKERITEVQRELGETVKKTTPVTPTPSAVPRAERIDFAEQVLALETALHTLLSQEDALHQQATGLQSALNKLSRGELEYSRLVRDAETNRSLHALLTEKFQAARIREQGEMKAVKVIDPAGPPVPLAAPRRLTFLLAAVGVAMVAGVGMPAAIEWLNKRVETEEDVEAEHLPVLALLPRLRSRRPIFLTLIEERRVKRLSDDFIFTEALRNLRVTVQLAMLGQRFRSLLITSPWAAEGKSTLVVNLGLAFEEAGSRVILVDADFLRPALHKRLKIPPSDGLAQALHTDGGIQPPLVAVVDRMWIAPGGRPFKPQTRGMLATNRLKQFVNDIGQQAELVICDCSPVLLVPDNLFLAAAVDAVIIVTKAGSTSCRDLERTKALLEGVRARVLGVVINELPASILRRQYNHYCRQYVGSEDR